MTESEKYYRLVLVSKVKSSFGLLSECEYLNYSCAVFNLSLAFGVEITADTAAIISFMNIHFPRLLMNTLQNCKIPVNMLKNISLRCPFHFLKIH